MEQPVSIVWFRDDLRLRDNAALHAAVGAGDPIIPLYIWSPHRRKPGKSSRRWAARSLSALREDLARLHSRLIYREGDPFAVIDGLRRDLRVARVFWNASAEDRDADAGLVDRLRASGVDARVCPGNLLFEPSAIHTASGAPYRVFTPFYNAGLKAPPPPAPLPAPRSLPAPAVWPEAGRIPDAGTPSPDWVPGEASAREALASWLDGPITGYAEARDRPDLDATSRLSAHLHFGEISARDVWHQASSRDSATNATPFLRQLMWREFAHHLLFHFPESADEPMRKAFAHFPWRSDTDALGAWQRGDTGYPLVDAGMRQLRRTGWMHNRVRMIAASFLTKHLLVDWREGASWFWENLVDADLANNTLGWQWVAGCGVDAAPFFRIFNPVTQGQKFDPAGDYVRTWVPELAQLPPRWTHQPFAAPDSALADAGVRLGRDYPRPIVDHAAARERALAAFETIRTAAT